MKITTLIALFVVSIKADMNFELFGLPLLTEYPCLDSSDIVTWFDPSLPPKEKNRYYVLVNRLFRENSVIQLSFDSDAYVLYNLGSKKEKFKKKIVRVEEVLTLRLLNRPKTTGIGFIVKGVVPGTVSYIRSIVINNREVCNQPNVGYLEKYIAETMDNGPQGYCGRRQIDGTELIDQDGIAKPRHWPWHTAIYRLERKKILKYICGGTLVSKNYVLTAAHCVSLRGTPLEPGRLRIDLGKHDLQESGIETQSRAVHIIILHEDFYYKKLTHDIALLKLQSEALFTDYVQPACLWFNKADAGEDGNLPTGQVIGTIVGWGFDNTGKLTPQLHQARMPMVSDITCMMSNPIFYEVALNGNTFCAGYLNGTASACNGDSGGGFHVFVPDKTPKYYNDTNTTGSWYIRGIISLTLSKMDAPICDPTNYNVFTDVVKYRPWIDAYLENEREDEE